MHQTFYFCLPAKVATISYSNMLSFRDIQRVEEHSEADIELKASAFSTHRINMFTQTITDN